MLEFFRRYQKIIYIIVTFVIILSFSFFGTYSAFTNTHVSDPVAFIAINGLAVHRARLEAMTAFIATDAEDLFAFGARGANFLNDGVVSEDFLKTGLALDLIVRFSGELKGDFEKRLKNEKNFTLYEHPKAKFLSTKSAWSYISPEMIKQYDQLVTSEDPLESSAVESRISLYQSQKSLTPHILRQVLTYQLRQYPWLAADPEMEKGDLFLFGYHSLEDWFGPAFSRLAAQTIINGAIVAAQKGYEVSDEEAWASLISQAQKAYTWLNSQNHQKGLGHSSAETLLSEQLLSMRLDQVQATEIWKQVLLFRRLLKDNEGGALVDAALLNAFVEYANTSATGNLYRLPEALRLSTFKDLQKMTFYLNRVANVPMNSLELPTRFLSIQEVKAVSPALVQKRYRVKLASVNQAQLRARVTLKETWNWEIDDANWLELQKNMTEVGISKAQTKEERYAYLQQLDSMTRKRIDQFARDRILAGHPEWIEQALSEAQTEEKILSLRSKGTEVLPGLKDHAQLIKQLDAATIASDESEPTLKQFSIDNQNFYRITLLEKAPEALLSFSQASADGTLDRLVDEYLESQYEKIRLNKVDLFRRADGEWKPFKDVSFEVAAEVFKELLNKINSVAKETLTPQAAAAYRLYDYMVHAQEEIQKKPENTDWIAEAKEETFSSHLTINEQWKLIKLSYKVTRSEQGEVAIKTEELLQLQPGAWSKVAASVNGDLAFFQLEKIETTVDKAMVTEKAWEAQRLLGNEIERLLFQQLLDDWISKGAFSLTFLKEAIDKEAIK